MTKDQEALIRELIRQVASNSPSAGGNVPNMPQINFAGIAALNSTWDKCWEKAEKIATERNALRLFRFRIAAVELRGSKIYYGCKVEATNKWDICNVIDVSGSN